MESEENQYAVVLFPNEDGELLSVDLIPKSWIFKKNDDLMCYYPTCTDKKKIDKWIKNNVDPITEWPSYDIEILAEAGKTLILYTYSYYIFIIKIFI